MAPRGPQPGDIIGELYRLESMIGTGGMGAVWSASALDSDDDRVAVKFLHTQMAADPLIVQRFLLEARAGIEVRHPNVVQVIKHGWVETGEPEPSPWLAMELLNGKSLGDTLRFRGRIDAVDALAIVADVTAGVAAAHDKGIVHRDIKPANIFLQQTDAGVVPKLLDFGISKYVEPGMDGGLTSTGAIVGSAMYMSPEQAAGGYNVDKRSDVWSLGVMLYRMLTGESPLPASGQQEIMMLLGSPKELDLSALSHPRIPPGAAGVVKKCLRKKREERYPSARELEPEIRKLLAAQIRASHAPNIDALLRPPSSHATFINAPLDSVLEATMPTAPTGAGVVLEAPSIVDASIAPLAGPVGTAPLRTAFVGPPTPRSARELTVRMESYPSLPPVAPLFPPSREPSRPASSIFAKAGAIALGIGIVAVGGFALKRRPGLPPPPAAAVSEPATSAAPLPVQTSSAQPPSEPDLELVEVPAPGPAGANGVKPPKKPPVPKKPVPKPPGSVDLTRKPGF